MVIYLDTLLLENFIVNYFLLYLTSQTVRIKPRISNLILSGILGALYVITKIYPSLVIFTSIIFKIVVACIMIFVVFNKKNILFYIKALFIYMLYSMVLAGVCFFIQLNQENYMGDFSISYNFAYKKLMIALIIIYLVIDRLVIYIKDRKDLDSFIFAVDIVDSNFQKKVLAFLDTGNELREPVTNLPVMILEKKYYSDFKIDEKDIFYIPYEVINGSGGKLKGFKPQYIKVHQGKEVKQREVIIAFCENKLSNLNDYHALLSRGII